MHQPASSTSDRLRTIRRRVTVAVLATFVAAWLAVAAFGKGGGQSSANAQPSGSSSQAAPSDGAERGGPGPSDDGSGAEGDGSQFDSPAPRDDSGSGSSGPAPLTSSQS
jgi:hypothetical protein